MCLKYFLVTIIDEKIREQNLSHPVLNRMLLSIYIYILLDWLSQLLVCREAVMNSKGGWDHPKSMSLTSIKGKMMILLMHFCSQTRMPGWTNEYHFWKVSWPGKCLTVVAITFSVMAYRQFSLNCHLSHLTKIYLMFDTTSQALKYLWIRRNCAFPEMRTAGSQCQGLITHRFTVYCYF